MNRKPSATDSSQGWWKTFLHRLELLDYYSGFDYMADRLRTLEEELAQLKRTQGSCLPASPASERDAR